ncbi:MAG: hypothetical protein WC974_04080 [Thermoplasmata archaeon]
MGLGLSAAFAIIVSGMLLATGMAVNTMESGSKVLNDGMKDRHILTMEKQQTRVWVAYAVILNNTTRLSLGDDITGTMLSVLCFNTGSKSIDLKNAEFFINGNIINRVKSMRILDGVKETRVWNESGWINSSLWTPNTGVKVFFDEGVKEGDIITVITDNGISASGAVSSGRLAVDIGPDIEIFEENTKSEEGPDHNNTITISANATIRSVQTNLDWYNALKWSPDIEKIVNAGEYYKYAWDADAADGIDFENPSSTNPIFTAKLAPRDLNGDGVMDPYIITAQVTDMITGETAQDSVRVLVRDCTPPKIKVVSNHIMAISDGKFAVINNTGGYVFPKPFFPQPIPMGVLVLGPSDKIYSDVDSSNPYYEVNEDTEVTFDAAIDTADEGIFTDNVAKPSQLRYAWDFDGDGKFDTNLSKDSLIVKHTFADPLRNLTNGNDTEETNYTVRLYVVDLEGNWNMTSQKVRVLDNTPPVAYFDVYPTPVSEDRPVTLFGDRSTDNFCNSTDLYYQWRFDTVYGSGFYPGWGGDSSIEESWHPDGDENNIVIRASGKENGYMNPTVTFYQPGEYNIMLTVWDYREGQGPISAINSYSKRITVLDTEPPTISGATPANNSNGLPWLNLTNGGVSFDATVSDNSGGKIFWTLYYYYNNSLDHWEDWGLTSSGKKISQSLTNSYGGSDAPGYSYQVGDYTAELRVWDECGNINSYSWYIHYAKP